ncbi:unnamed protein product [Scytosiphon promiscuus]
MKLSKMPATRLLFLFSAVLALGVRVRAFLLPSTAVESEVNNPQARSSLRPGAKGAVRSTAHARRRRRSPGVAALEGEKNLFDCIREEDLETLQRYVDRGGPVHVADTLGDTSLLVAASTGNVEVVKILCEAPDAAVNYPCFHGGETPLMAACTKGYLAVAEYLIKEAEANVNAMNHRGDTALSLAAFWGRVRPTTLYITRRLPSINLEVLFPSDATRALWTPDVCVNSRVFQNGSSFLSFCTLILFLSFSSLLTVSS